MLTEVRKEILTFHHEGFFWRCWFFGEGHSETIWTFWYSKYDATTPYPQHPLTVWIANKYKKGFQGWGDNCLSLILFLFSLSRYQKQTLLTLFGLFFDLHFALRVHRNVETSWWHLIYHNKVFIEWWLSPARTTLPPRPYLLMSVFSQGLLNLSPCLPWQQGGGVFSHRGAKCSHLPLVSAWGRLDVHACGLLECSGPLAVGSGGPWRAVFLLLSTQDLYCKISPVLLLKVIEITRVNKQKWMQKRLVLFWFFFFWKHIHSSNKIEGEGETCSETTVGAGWWLTCTEVWGLGPVNQVLPPERAKEWDQPPACLAPALLVAEPATGSQWVIRGQPFPGMPQP